MNDMSARNVAWDLLIAVEVRNERQELAEMEKKTVRPWKLRALTVAEVSKGEAVPFTLLVSMMGLTRAEVARVTAGIPAGSPSQVMEQRLARLSLAIVGRAMADADTEIFGKGYFHNGSRDEALEYAAMGLDLI